jgi:hypothetical protein
MCDSPPIVVTEHNENHSGLTSSVGTNELALAFEQTCSPTGGVELELDPESESRANVGATADTQRVSDCAIEFLLSPTSAEARRGLKALVVALSQAAPHRGDAHKSRGSPDF